jgi:arsenate reductase (glutaredoxin)
MKATIWHNPACGTSRKTLAILEEAPGIDLTVIRYLDQPYDRATLTALLADAGLSPRDALRCACAAPMPKNAV